MRQVNPELLTDEERAYLRAVLRTVKALLARG
jgi:hypothetical protein